MLYHVLNMHLHFTFKQCYEEIIQWTLTQHFLQWITGPMEDPMIATCCNSFAIANYTLTGHLMSNNYELVYYWLLQLRQVFCKTNVFKRHNKHRALCNGMQHPVFPNSTVPSPSGPLCCTHFCKLERHHVHMLIRPYGCAYTSKLKRWSFLFRSTIKWP